MRQEGWAGISCSLSNALDCCQVLAAASSPRSVSLSGYASGLLGEMSPVKGEAASEQGPGAGKQQKGHSPHILCSLFPLRLSAWSGYLHRRSGSRCGAALPLVRGPLWLPVAHESPLVLQLQRGTAAPVSASSPAFIPQGHVGHCIW